jgi:hypothetical protein
MNASDKEAFLGVARKEMDAAYEQMCETIAKETMMFPSHKPLRPFTFREKLSHRWYRFTYSLSEALVALARCINSSAVPNDEY